MKPLIFVNNYNNVHPIQCVYYDFDTARREVAEQLRRFRVLGRTCSIIRRGSKWRIGGEVVRMVNAEHSLNWSRVSPNYDYEAAGDLTARIA